MSRAAVLDLTGSVYAGRRDIAAAVAARIANHSAGIFLFARLHTRTRALRGSMVGPASAELTVWVPDTRRHLVTWIDATRVGFSATVHPTADWVAQQARNLVMDLGDRAAGFTVHTGRWAKQPHCERCPSRRHLISRSSDAIGSAE